MSSDSGLKLDLSLHLENLLPGVLVAGLAFAIPRPSWAPPWLVSAPKDEFLYGLLFVSTSYMLGIASIVISRLTIDSLSRITFRWMFIWLYEQGVLKRQTKLKLSVREVLRLYMEALARVAKEGQPEIKLEVGRRRERARLFRSLSVPVVMTIWISTLDNKVWLTVAAVGLITMIYSYCELMVYQEASLGFSSEGVSP